MNRAEDVRICEALGWTSIRSQEDEEWGTPPAWAAATLLRGHTPFFALPTWTLFDCAAVAALLPMWISPVISNGRVTRWHVRLMSPELYVERSEETMGAAIKATLLRAALQNPTALRALLP